MDSLEDIWLRDQALALSATLLADLPNAVDRWRIDEVSRATQVIADLLSKTSLTVLSDSTISLLASVPTGYANAEELQDFDAATPLTPFLAQVRQEVEARKSLLNQQAKSAERRDWPEILISHAVHVLSQDHLSVEDFLKWVQRVVMRQKSVIGYILDKLEADGQGNQASEDTNALLAAARGNSRQTRDRVEAIDRLHRRISELAGSGYSLEWWTRTCLAFRNSLYCWPLMVSVSEMSELNGISLPVGLFLSPDDNSKVYFKKIVSRGSREPPTHFVAATRDLPAHLTGSKLYWNREWGDSFVRGLRIAKALWKSQNGRFNFVNSAAAEHKMKESLIVDLGPACAIVDFVFGPLQAARFELAGRSAEAYWTQAVLGLLLPGSQLPTGVVTGKVVDADGAFELRHVEGIRKKLEYADRAGFSRIVLPPGEEDEVEAFQNRLKSMGNAQRIEMNVCQNARSAADAMQPSGWRRSYFLRLPEVQQSFSTNLRRLFMRQQLERGEAIKPAELRTYRRNPWEAAETKHLENLDRFLCSRTKAIKFWDCSKHRTDIESDIGKWLAWKDEQVREGQATGARGPGLGVLCIRTAARDNEMRVWAAIADALCASPDWWEKFQWSSRDQAAELLAQLLGNQRADPTISASPAPDILVIFDGGDFTRTRRSAVFPDDFRGRWRELLNPTKGTRNTARKADDPLSEALLRMGGGRLGPTRIIVIQGSQSTSPWPFPEDLSDDDRAALRRLSIFRYGFSRQAAYSIINFRRPTADNREWPEIMEQLGRLVQKGLLKRTRGQYHIPAAYRQALNGAHVDDPAMHYQAAKVLVPILEPTGHFLSSNRDREFEPEPVLEATWHLSKARDLLSKRDISLRPRCSDAASRLNFLRPFPDWDTVFELRAHPQTQNAAVELGRELLSREQESAKRLPHSSRIAAHLATIARLSGSNLDEMRLQSLQTEVEYYITMAHKSITTTFTSARWGQYRKLYSDYLYCLKALGIRGKFVKRAENYLQAAMAEISSDAFLTRVDRSTDYIHKFPISQDFWRVFWLDQNLAPRSRLAYAFCATRANLGAWVDGKQTRMPWDLPWLEYFALTEPLKYGRDEVVTQLRTWHRVYGSDENLAAGFGREIRDYRPYTRPVGGESWGERISRAIDNLWMLIEHRNPRLRLPESDQAIAVTFTRVVVLQETMPSFDFLNHRGPDWLRSWARLSLDDEYSEPWRLLGRGVIGSIAGWIYLLSAAFSRGDRMEDIVGAWLSARARLSMRGVRGDDPERLLSKIDLDKVSEFHACLAAANANGHRLLGAQRNGQPLISGIPRADLREILQELKLIGRKAGTRPTGTTTGLVAQSA